jgi:cellulose synthase/poly-beta-1,6-N-acetylglucosamine synthase-like glycosyltransferase
MKISYAITVCNEFVEIQNLLLFLLKHKRHEDEIVVLYDSKNGSKSIEQFLRAKSINSEFSWHKGEFNGHFANWKNKLTNFCKGDYIFQIDADELPPKYLVENLWTILEMNKTVDVYRVPRINTVKGLMEQFVILLR